MPELPEVETVVRSIQQKVINKEFSHLKVFWTKTLSTHTQTAACSILSGNKIEQLSRRGKYIIFKLTKDYIIIHLRMTGKLIYKANENSKPKHLRTRFNFTDGSILDFTDIRKFGRIELINNLDYLENKLGKEPKECSPSYLIKKLASRKRSIKASLLDQSIIAGLGNIYTDEILWKSKINPMTPSNKLTLKKINLIIINMQKTINDAINHMGTTFLTFSFEGNKKGNYGSQLKVFSKTNQPCPNCSTPIKKIKIIQRGTYLCPKCQN